MRSTVSLEQGLKNLRALCGEFGHVLPRWNEADTRFQFIDRLLVECFGWPRELIHTESRLDEEYRDYVLGAPSEIVWEAKRSGIHFDFPADADGGLVQSLSAITKVSKSADAAIRQAQGYCNSAGIEFAVICNGDQLVAFTRTRYLRLSRHGPSWL
jgi:predicted type IV restriction endonuclease